MTSWRKERLTDVYRQIKIKTGHQIPAVLFLIIPILIFLFYNLLELFMLTTNGCFHVIYIKWLT